MFYLCVLRPGELAAHWVSAAQGVASIATMAAHSAYSTARDVFRTLQARDKVVIKHFSSVPVQGDPDEATALSNMT